MSFPSCHQCDELRLRLEPAELRLRVEPERERFLERERPPDPRVAEDDLLRPPDSLRRLPEELELERRDAVCFLLFCGCGECECSLSWMSSNSA